jgi:YD repeat-containing protein
MKLSTLTLSASLIALTCSSTISTISACAGDVPSYVKKPYDVTMTSTTPAGPNTIRTSCDGKGHLRSEVDTQGQKTISLIDYPAMTVTSLIVAQKMMIKMPMPAQEDPITDAESAKKAHAKDLGSKVMNGHPCHGYETKKDDTTTQTWVGDDIHYLVHSELTTPKMKCVTDLKSYSDKAPEASLFDVPAGYKEMKMPAMPATASSAKKGSAVH